MLKNLTSFLGLVTSILIFHISAAQTITGRVTDASTGRSLPYVHIGVKNTSKGTISKDDGTYILNIEDITSNEKIFFSILGYKETSIPISQIESFKLNLQLEPSSISLSEVIVNNKARKFKKVKIGNFKNSTTTTGKSGDEPFGWGGEWGIILPKQQKEYKIEDVNFHLRFNTVDSILFRVNVYRVLDDKNSFESLLKKPAFITSKANEKWISINMNDRDIWVEEDILVTMEWVRIWYADEGQNLIFFSQAKSNQYKVLHRENSYGEWLTNKKPALAIYVNGLFEKW